VGLAELVLPAAELVGGRVVGVVVGDELADRGGPPVFGGVADRVGGEEVAEERDPFDLGLAGVAILAARRQISKLRRRSASAPGSFMASRKRRRPPIPA
jgi:hypothetical protein